MRPSSNALVAALLLVSLATTPARAAWPTDTSANLPVCTTSGSASSISIASDGAGGTIVAWYEGASVSPGAYVQRIDGLGNVLWTTNGVPLSSDTGGGMVQIVSDGAGGAIAAWFDNYAGGSVMAQRIGPSGTMLWTAGGVLLMTGAMSGFQISLVPDGAGGAVCTWSPGPSGYAVHAQRVNAAGVVKWAGAGGVPVTARTNTNWPLLIVPDGTGGLIGAWSDWHTGNYITYAQRLDGTGARRWGADGIAIDTLIALGWRPAIASDDAGGAIVAWDDMRGGYPYQIFAQRLDSTGTDRWVYGGVPFAPTGKYQVADTLRSDGAGGVFAAWQDGRQIGAGLWAQHLDPNGAPLWGALGAPVDTSTGVGAGPFSLAGDGAGGLLVTYGSSGDIRAQSLSAGGVARWGVHGAPVSTASGVQVLPVTVGDGHGGLTAAWPDLRSGSYSPVDVYAQHIGNDGAAGDAGVPLASAPTSLAFAAPWPNPAHAGAAIELRGALSAPASVRLTIRDVAGRTVRVLADGARDAGAWTARWDGRDAAGRALGAGLYFAQLDAGVGHASRKLVLAP